MALRRREQSASTCFGHAASRLDRWVVALRCCIMLLCIVGTALACCLPEITAHAEESAQKKRTVPDPSKSVLAIGASTGEGWSAQTCAGVGDTVAFRLEATLPEDLSSFASYGLWFNDRLDKGLAYVPNSVRTSVVHSDATSDDVSLSVEIEGQTMRVGSDDVKSVMPGLASTDVIVVEYDCVVSPEAACGLLAGNENTLTLQYSSAPGLEELVEHSKKPIATVYCFQIDLHKVGEDDGSDLSGACFVIQNDQGMYRTAAGSWTKEQAEAQVVATDESGIASFVALGEGTYTLTETTAPQGYELLEGPIEVTLAASDLDGSQRTLTATVAGSGAAVEAVDGATGVATVAVEDPKSKEPVNPDDTTNTTSGNKTTSSGTSSAGTGTTRTQLATTADPSCAIGVGALAAAVVLVVVGVALRLQGASICDARRGFAAQDGNGRWRGRQSRRHGRTNR